MKGFICNALRTKELHKKTLENSFHKLNLQSAIWKGAAGMIILAFSEHSGDVSTSFISVSIAGIG